MVSPKSESRLSEHWLELLLQLCTTLQILLEDHIAVRVQADRPRALGKRIQTP